MKIVPDTLAVRNQDMETKAEGKAEGVEEAVRVEESYSPENGQHCPKRINSVFKMEGQLPQQPPIINLSA
jgi:hypothetical protein